MPCRRKSAGVAVSYGKRPKEYLEDEPIGAAMVLRPLSGSSECTAPANNC
jgi:hypothetical protein